MSEQLDDLGIVSWFVAYLMAVTVIALVGERVVPHATAMWAAARMSWMEIRKEREGR